MTSVPVRGVGIDGANGPQASGGVHQLWVLLLEPFKTIQENFATRLDICQEVILLDGLEHRLEQDQLA